ncbi:MAG: hypothetical protein GXY89_07735, partial [Tissierellia bacterium]|nr:hypothetical protein [Tissierellia bacterium]
YSKSEFEDILEEVNLTEYFGDISLEEFINLFF